MRNNSPAARDKFSCSRRDLLIGLRCPGTAPFVAAVEIVGHPELAAHPFAEEEDTAAQIKEAGGNPEDQTGGYLVAM